MKIFNFLLPVFALSFISVLAEDPCPRGDGFYKVLESCDQYIECFNGVTEPRICDDGLVFNIKQKSNPCSYLHEIKCPYGEAGMQPPKSTKDCPRLFGLYGMGDAKNCGKYKECVKGVAHIRPCADGLAWNSTTYACDYPDLVKDCNAEDFLDFVCPDKEGRYAYRENCQKFYLCTNGLPRRLSCDKNQAFNDDLKKCVAIENVTSCSPDIVEKAARIKKSRYAAHQ